MDCQDCLRKSGQLRLLMERLTAAATAHGYELWLREGAVPSVLAIPNAASHGTPQALVDTFQELGVTGLPKMPGWASANRGRRSHPAKRAGEIAQTSYQIDGVPPLELVFIDSLA